MPKSPSNAKKSNFLGMDYGTASNRLKKLVMFDMAQRLGEAVCYRCGESINTVDEFTLEHKQPWLDIDSDLFWALDNLAWSHAHCNTQARRAPRAGRGPEGTNWCGGCRTFLPFERFHRSRKDANGLDTRCRSCRSVQKKQSHVA